MAPAHPDIHFVAVSHSEQAATDKWLAALPDPNKNSQPNLQIIVDDKREAYAAWGLGTSSIMHVLGSLSAVSKLKEDGIKVRPTESGGRCKQRSTHKVHARQALISNTTCRADCGQFWCGRAGCCEMEQEG
jgi:hypothetical protein